MKTNLAILLLSGLPLISNAYNLTIKNESSLPMKIKEVGASCMILNPRKLILQPNQEGVINYEYYKTYKDCPFELTPKPDPINSHQIAIDLFPYGHEDPELEATRFNIAYYHKDYSSIPTNWTCAPYDKNLTRCYYTYQWANEPHLTYKITADFDSITISDK